MAIMTDTIYINALMAVCKLETNTKYNFCRKNQKSLIKSITEYKE